MVAGLDLDRRIVTEGDDALEDELEVVGVLMQLLAEIRICGAL